MPIVLRISDPGLRIANLGFECTIRNPQSAMWLSFDQTDVAGAGPFLRILWGELDTLALAQQLEHCAADGAAVEEVLDSAFVADEPEAFVDEKPCDCPGWHNPNPSRSEPLGISQGNSAGCGRLRIVQKPSGRGAGRVSSSVC